MVIRRLSLTLALCGHLAGVSCTPMGETCGRGRCHAGATCVSVFGDGRDNTSWSKPEYPNADNEWWCVAKCPHDKTCPGKCMRDPTREEDVVCATDQVAVDFRSEGKSCLCGPGTSCFANDVIDHFDVTEGCGGAATVLTTCPPKTSCPIGTLNAGDAVPGVHLYSPTGREEAYCPAQPSNQLGSLLPEGKTVVVYVDSGCN